MNSCQKTHFISSIAHLICTQDDNWENFSEDIVQKMRQIIYLIFYNAMVEFSMLGFSTLGFAILGFVTLGFVTLGFVTFGFVIFVFAMLRFVTVNLT